MCSILPRLLGRLNIPYSVFNANDLSELGALYWGIPYQLNSMLPSLSPETGLDSSQDFGHEALKLFQLDPAYVNLNSGSFGALPCAVEKACNELSVYIESNPDRFVRMEYNTSINRLRARLAAVVGADENECVLVPNVATGINTILRNFEWKTGDVIVVPSTTYATIARSINEIANRNNLSGPTIEVFSLTFPTSASSILSRFTKTLRQVKGKLLSEHPTSKIVAIFDSIVSLPAIRMPWEDMVEICRAEGVVSIVDGAHSIGQERINLSDINPDFWVSNCSKWLFAKRGSAILYVPYRNQQIIKSSIPPALGYVPSSDDEQISDFVTQFYWNASSDIVALLSPWAALDFRKSIGGEEKIINYCHTLAVNGGKLLAEMMGTEFMASELAEDLIASMANVELPLDGSIKPSHAITRKFQTKLLLEHKVYASHFYHNNRWWVRVSAQIFNDMDDFHRLGAALISVCEEVGKDFQALDN